MKFGKLLTWAIHLRRDTKHFFELIKYSYRASRVFHMNFLSIFKKSLILKYKLKYDPSSIFSMGLLNPSKDIDELKTWISRERLSYLQLKFNPWNWKPVTENKAIFYKFCEAFTLPAPKLYAIFNKNNTGWGFNGFLLRSQNDWENFLNSVMPDRFLIKPSTGVYGQKIIAFTRTNKCFLDHTEKAYTASEIFEYIHSDNKYNSFVFQERLFSHQSLVDLSGSTNLHTLRIVTFVEPDGDVSIHSVYLKIIVGENLIDNQAIGITGNIISCVDIETGRILSSTKDNLNGKGPINVSCHPVTGKELNGFEIPKFHKVLSIAKKAAIKFLPLRTIGWDFALTDESIFLIEGNMFYDDPMHKIATDNILEKLRAEERKLEEYS